MKPGVQGGAIEPFDLRRNVRADKVAAAAALLTAMRHRGLRFSDAVRRQPRKLAPANCNGETMCRRAIRQRKTERRIFLAIHKHVPEAIMAARRVSGEDLFGTDGRMETNGRNNRIGTSLSNA